MSPLSLPLFEKRLEPDRCHGGSKTAALPALFSIFALALGLGSDIFTAKARAVVVAPTVIGFDDVTMGPGNGGTPISTYDGFDWTTSTGTASGFHVYSTSQAPGSFDGNNLGITSGNQAIYNTDGLDTAVTLTGTALGKSTFTLSSMELSCAKQQNPFDLEVIGYALVSGTYQEMTHEIIDLTTSNATLESFSGTNWSGLSKVVFESVDSNGNLLTSFSTATTFRVDDFAYTTQAVLAVPEPRTWAGLAAAVGAAFAIGLSVRKPKLSAQAIRV
jgi:hypothetical protein